MNRRVAWMGALLALGFAADSGAQARLVPGTSNSLPQLVSRHGTFALGKKPYPKGTRDQWLAEGRALAKAPDGYFPRLKALKGAANNRQYLPPIGNQGSEGSCVHWAGAYYSKTANMKRNDPALNVSATSNQCSPRFTYNLVNAGADNGGWGHEPYEIFMRYGGASLKQKPYVAGQYAALPTVADFVEGLHRRTANYVWVWEWNPTATQINELKTYLEAGGVAVCGVYAEDSFDAWSPGDAPWVGPTCTQYDINHMVTVCGYGTGFYLVANSWGTSFGSNGFIVVDAEYFENYFSDVMYPLEGTYEPATQYAKVQIQHGRRSDVRSLSFSVNGTTVWSNSPLPRNAPMGTGTFDTDSRDDWALAVDLSAGPWAAANVVTARCMDRVTGTAGFLTNFTLFYGGQNRAASNTPVAMPDNTGIAAAAWVSTPAPGALGIRPASTNVPAAASSGRTLAVTGSVTWTAATNAPWLAITAGQAGTNNGTVVFRVAAQTGTSARTGTIAVAGGGIAATCTVIQAGAAPAVGNVFAALSVPGQVGTTMVNLIYGGRLGTPVYTFHVPYGSGISSLAPTFSLPAGATASPASGTARNFTAPLVAYAVTYGGQTRTNYVRCVVLPPSAAIAGTNYDAGAPTLRDVWVDPAGGSDTAGNGTSRARAYRTINRAWADVPAQMRFSTTGYRLMLCPGTYANDRSWMEHRYGTYDFPLVLQAADGPGTAILAYDMQFFSCNYVYLRDLVFEPDNGGDGLHLDSCEFVLMKNCAIRGGPGTQRLAQEALKANQSEYLYVEDCEIANASENALDYMCCHYGHIRRSRLHDAGDWVAYVKGGSSDFIIEGNEFYNGGTGGFVAGQGAGSEFLTAPWIHYQASNVRFVNNVVRDCEGAGFGVNGARNVLFAYNTLYRVGSRSHGIEVAFGNNSLDGAAEAPIAQTYQQWGGWTHASTTGDQRIPNRNVYVYNNVLYNPLPFRSTWQHFEFTGPWSANTNPNVPWPATTDENLQIKGNVLWNGPPSLDLGIGPGTACQPGNPTCNAALLTAQNHINQFAPQMVDPAAGDFRPVASGNLLQATAYAIPPFPDEAPLTPAEPAGSLSNSVPVDRAGSIRVQAGPPGAYGGGMELIVTPWVRTVGSAAGTATFAITNAGGGAMAFAASETESWLAIAGGGNGTNGGTLVVSYGAHSGTTVRTGTVAVAAPGASGSPRIVSIVQDGIEPIALALQPASTNVPAPASSGRQIKVTASGPWAATPDVSWLSISGGGSGNGDGTATYNVESNGTGFSRTGTITVAGIGNARAFTVNQIPAGGVTGSVLSVSPSSWSFGSIELGRSTNHVFTVKNAGKGFLSGSASVAPPFYVVGGPDYLLGPGASHAVAVQYDPATAGSHRQTVSFTGGAGAGRTVTGSAKARLAAAVPGGGGTVSGAGLYSPGALVTLTARPATGHTFLHWEDGSQVAVRKLVMPDVHLAVAATFGLTADVPPPAVVNPGPQQAMVGVRFSLTLDVSSACLPTVAVSGLPSGLKYDAASRSIAGVPLVPTNRLVTVGVRNSAGKAAATQTFAIAVAPLPLWAWGSFNGWCLVGPADNPDAGAATLSISRQGGISGKLLAGGSNYVFRATSYAAGSTPAGGFLFSANATAGKTSLPLNVTVATSLAPGGPVGLSVASGGGPAADVAMYRDVWQDADMAGVASNLNGYYTAALPRADSLAEASGEFGSGYLAFTLNKGSVKAAGKLADGTSLSLSSRLLTDRSNRTFVVLYGAPSGYKGGSFFGLAEFYRPAPAGRPVALRPWEGSPFVWESRNPQATGEPGVGFVRELGLVGGWYDLLGNLYAYYADKALEVGTSDQARVPELIVGSNAYPSVWWDPDGLALRVLTNRYGVMTGLAAPALGAPIGTSAGYDYGTPTNAIRLTLSWVRATGAFQGIFRAWFDYGRTHTYRNVSYSGLMIPGRENPADGLEGRGFFRWQDRSYYLDRYNRLTPYHFYWSHDFVIRSDE